MKALKNLKNIVLKLLIIVVGFFAYTTSVHSQDTLEQQQRIKTLVDDLRCPTCQGLSVKDSEAGFSVSIRNKAEEMVREGYSDQEIRNFFVKRYGEWILRTPPKEGFNLLLWILPIGAILFGMGMVLIKSRRWVASKEEEDEQELPEALSEAEENLIRQDLERFRQN